MAFGIGSSLVFRASCEKGGLYYTPSELIGLKINKNRLIHIGGMVIKNAVRDDVNSDVVRFSVRDAQHSIQVHYCGILPALFSAGQLIIAQGYLQKEGLFRANQVLIKQSENCLTV